MRRRLIRRQRATDPFIDLLFNALLGFTFLFLVAVMFMNPEARKGRVNLKAEYIISVTWPEQLADDIDLWVQDPIGETVSYLRKDASWLHLDRDDRGVVNDTVIIGGESVVYPINQEIVTIRGVIPGEYTVNLYYYREAAPGPVGALVKVEKVNPTLTTVFVERVQLTEQDEERTVVRFTLDDLGRVAALSRLPKRLTPYALEP
ncbi:MAG: hypothetical protein KDI88_08640 [Gammaproteobacteria bacterium]|nr:hypothetical protein [Gammaproteobacteria bacterium]